MAKWPSHNISGKQSQKGKSWLIVPLKRPNGSPGLSSIKRKGRGGGKEIHILAGSTKVRHK